MEKCIYYFVKTAVFSKLDDNNGYQQVEVDEKVGGIAVFTLNL